VAGLGAGFPKISIVTPSYNQGRFIETTIQSVLSQNYPNLEYFVMDGGSTDETVKILKRYESRFTFWTSEKDGGQSHAINKGFARSTGDILAWINADDIYLKDSFAYAARFFREHPRTMMLYGGWQVVDEGGRVIESRKARKFDLREAFFEDSLIGQPAVFFRKEFFQKIGWLDEALQYVMDYDLWLRGAMKVEMRRTPRALAAFRRHQSQKTAGGSVNLWSEKYRSLRKFFSDPCLAPGVRIWEKKALSHAAFEASFSALRVSGLSSRYSLRRLFRDTALEGNRQRALARLYLENPAGNSSGRNFGSRWKRIAISLFSDRRWFFSRTGFYWNARALLGARAVDFLRRLKRLILKFGNDGRGKIFSPASFPAGVCPEVRETVTERAKL
jgi:glycosyltransferase involved in cell wall biosynthesis